MNWIIEETKALDIGDKRLDKRMRLMLETLSTHPNCSLNEAFKTRKELTGAYRFFSNDFVTEQKILEPHFESTLCRISNQKTVLLLADSSLCDYSSKKGIEGLGMLANSFRKGLIIHPMLAMTENKVALGIVDSYMWTRAEKPKKMTSSERENQPLEEKESFRWLVNFKATCEMAKKLKDTHFIMIADREADIFEVFMEAWGEKKNGGPDVLIRAKHDRLVNQEEETTLKKAIKKAPALGQIQFTYENRNKQTREVTQTIRAKQMTLTGKRFRDTVYPSISINVIMAQEEEPPEGKEALCWILLTTLPIDTLDQVLQAIKHYLCRYQIEVFFKILKSGFQIEKRYLQEAESLMNMIALLFIVAWRIMYITTFGRQQPDIKCTELFESAEWKSVYKILYKNARLPKTPPTLGEFIIMIAQLGGYLNRKRDPPPGPQVIWKGLKRMADYTLAWETFGKN